MYEHQEMKGYGGYEYVVRGAEVSCSYGSKTCVLNLKDDHGVHTSDGRPLITENDSTTDNIKGFGMCNKNRSKPCKCDPKLGKWWATDNSNMKIFDTAVGEESYAVTEDSLATCNKGGIVSFKTSGQTSPSYDNVKIKNAVEIVEDEKKNWSRKSDRKDFIGHVKVKNSGLYNFGIEFYDIKSGNSPGSVFVYEKSWGKTKYIGAYEIKSHAGNKEMKFPDDVLKINGNSYGYVSGLHYWFYWIDIILYGGKDYYFEVDCPGRDGFDYKLIGNVDEVSYTGKTTTISNGDKLIPYSGGMYWMLDREVELMSQKVYELSAVVRFVMYLDSDYATAIYDLLCKNYIDSKIEDNKDIYKAMKLAYNKIKDQVDVTDFYIMGYSLGGTNAAVLSYIDEKEKAFNFKRVFMVNPPVELYDSAVKLDKYLDDYTGGKSAGIEKLLNTTLAKVKGGLTSEYANIGADTIYEIVKGDIFEYTK